MNFLNQFQQKNRNRAIHITDIAIGGYDHEKFRQSILREYSRGMMISEIISDGRLEIQNTSSKISDLPAISDVSITKQKTVAISASSGPKRVSLPHGAGKWPIIYVICCGLATR